MSRLFVFVCAVLIAAPAIAAPPVVTNPEWLKKPSGEDFDAAWPAKALDRRMSGGAVIRCDVTTQGLLANCKVLNEHPQGWAFGAAALLLAPAFVMKPATVDGKPVEAQVTIPLAFENQNSRFEPDADDLTPLSTVRLVPWVRWAEVPSYADVVAAYPRKALVGGGEGQVVLRCAFTPDEHLKDCDTTSATPKEGGFKTAAIELSKRFRADLEPANLARLRVNLAIHFPAPGAQSANRYLTQVDWTAELDPAKAQAVYPDQAVKAGVKSGQAIVDCTVADTGALTTCAVLSEAPAGVGFGAAAVRIASEMAVNLWTRDGQPAAGAHIRLPLQLQYAGELPPAAAQGEHQASSPAPAHR